LNISECLGDGGTITPPPRDAGVPDAGPVPDAGGVVVDGGNQTPDAGESDAGAFSPVVLQALPTNYPAPMGCGCGAADGTGWLALLGWCLTRVARRRGKNQ